MYKKYCVLCPAMEFPVYTSVQLDVPIVFIGTKIEPVRSYTDYSKDHGQLCSYTIGQSLYYSLKLVLTLYEL